MRHRWKIYNNKINSSIVFRLANLFLKNRILLKKGRTVSTSLRIVYRNSFASSQVRDGTEVPTASTGGLCALKIGLWIPPEYGRSPSDKTNKKIFHLRTTRTKFSKKSSVFRQHEQNSKKILQSSDNTDKILKKILRLQTTRTKFSKKSSIFRQHEQNYQKNPPSSDNTNKILNKILLLQTTPIKFSKNPPSSNKTN